MIDIAFACAALAGVLDAQGKLIVEEKHFSPDFIPKNAYDITRDAFKTCLGCGASTQPCCGH